MSDIVIANDLDPHQESLLSLVHDDRSGDQERYPQGEVGGDSGFVDEYNDVSDSPLLNGSNTLQHDGGDLLLESEAGKADVQVDKTLLPEEVTLGGELVLPSLGGEYDTTTSIMAMSSSVQVSLIPQISITEVRIDGTDEYIELTNWGDHFVGDLTLSGAKSSTVNISVNMDRHESIIVGDSLAHMIISGIDTISNQGLSMTDTSARNLYLFYQGSIIDSLELTAAQVLGSDNQSASREYDFEHQVWQITPLLHTRHMQSGHYGNPGGVWGLTIMSDLGAVTTGSTTGNTLSGSISSGYVGTGLLIPNDDLSGGITTGTINSGVLLTGSTISGALASGSTLSGVITSANVGATGVSILQAYPFADCIGEHLALKFAQPYQGKITINGLGSSDSPKSFDVSVSEPGIRYVVESLSGVVSDNVILVPSMTLTDAGEMLVMKDSQGTIMDTVIYSSTKAGHASSYSSTSGGVRLLTTQEVPLLATACKQSFQLPQIGGCRIQMADSIYVTGAFAGGFTVSGSDVQPGCQQGSRSVNGQILGSETCSLSQSLSAGSHRITYQQMSGDMVTCEDEIMFYGAIQAQVIAPTISSSNIVCLGSDKTYYESLYRKRKLKHDNLTNALEYVGLTVTSNDDVYGSCDQTVLSGDMLVSRFDPSKSTTLQRIGSGGDLLMIYAIIADGTGNDRDGTESITLLNTSHSTITLEGLQLVVNNKVIELLTGTLLINSFLTLTDYFPLPNAGGCVAVIADGAMYDQVCYGKYKPTQMVNFETLIIPKSLIPKSASSTTKSKSTKTGVISKGSDLINVKTCLQLEEYQLLQLDIKEQKLINKAQKSGYQSDLDEFRARYRSKTDKLFNTYRSITDSKQAYIDRQQSYITSQQEYIDKLKGQAQRCNEYTSRITELYNNNKSYTNTLKDGNQQLYFLKKQITSQYPALTLDPVIGEIVGIESVSGKVETTNIITNNSSITSKRRSTIKQTISNLF